MSTEAESAIQKRWFRRQVVAGARSRLFMFPYAGGGARVFRKWNAWCAPEIECVGVELPGRGTHRHEPPISSMAAMIECLTQAIKPLLDKPFSLFGYSIGALIAFELSRSLLRSGHGTAEHLFVGGMCSPDLVHIGEPLHVLDDQEFMQAIRALNGTPLEVLEQPRLFEAFVPVLRADFRLGETYVHTSAPPLPTPITVFGGIQDEAAPSSSLHQWRLHTSNRCTVRLLEGDHFFIRQHEHLMAATVMRSLHEGEPAGDRSVNSFSRTQQMMAAQT
jgi:surfactin synthase thioesterase subunit